VAVDDSAFATMIMALVSSFADLMRLDPTAATPDTVTRALSALWAGIQRSPDHPRLADRPLRTGGQGTANR
jgi:hypothetical protein